LLFPPEQLITERQLAIFHQVNVLDQQPGARCDHLFWSVATVTTPRILSMAPFTMRANLGGMFCGVRCVGRLTPLGLGYALVGYNGSRVTYTGHMALTARPYHRSSIQ